jgi:hypothetical protein
MKNKFFVLGMLAIALALGFVFIGCDTGTIPGDTFVAVTDITDVPTIAIKGTPLSLSGTVVPSNATNRTIVWSGTTGVDNGILTATSEGTVTVTATITNGTAESSSYTQSFTIMVYDAGNSSGTNPFCDDTTPFYWGKENSGGMYVKVKSDSWESWDDDGTAGDSGTYERIGGIAAQWTVTGGTGNGDTGLAVIESGQMLVRNLTNEYSGANGTLTKLTTSLTLGGTWKTSGASYSGYYMKIVATGGNFTVSVSLNNSTWVELIKGTYPASGSTNPATCTISEVNIGVFTNSADNWVAWGSLSQGYKNEVGGSETPTIVVYSNKCEGLGLVLQKQP